MCWSLTTLSMVHKNAQQLLPQSLIFLSGPHQPPIYILILTGFVLFCCLYGVLYHKTLNTDFSSCRGGFKSTTAPS